MILYLLLILTINTIYSQNSSLCETKSSCDSCISIDSVCAWCLNEAFEQKRCNTKKNLILQGCSSVYYPETSFIITKRADNEYYIVQPEAITATFRAMSSINFDIRVNLIKYMKAETMILIDFSRSMEQVFNAIIELTENFTNVATQLGLSKVGYAKFVDKTSHPVIYHPSFDTSKPGHPFNFAIISGLSDNPQQLVQLLKSQVISFNADIPEAVFDAIIQVAKCNQVGWSTSKTMAKNIVVFSDSFSQTQGFGRMVGVIKPNDMACHVNAKGMDLNGMDFDYSSPGQTAYAIRQAGINIVFAVTSNVRRYYEVIQQHWTGINTAVVDLDPSALDLLKILTDSNRQLNSKIKLSYTPNEDLEITIQTNCSTRDSQHKPDECLEVELGDELIFNVNIKLLKFLGNPKIVFTVSPLASIDFEYDFIRSCPCSNIIGDRQRCTNNGAVVCGACECDTSWGGKKCECRKEFINSEEACTNPNTGTVCSNRGTCDNCGKCNCNTAPDGLVYGGIFCECARTLCAKINDLICSGPDRGICECDVCSCKEGYTGLNCELLDCNYNFTNLRCKKEAILPECSGNGECKCGVCKCQQNSFGEFCENITNSVSCNDFHNPVNCIVHNTPISENYGCNSSITNVRFGQERKYTCVMFDKYNCKIYFSYDVDKTEIYQIIVKIYDSKTDCPKPVNVVLITVLVFVILLVIGAVLIGLYFLSLYLYYRADYQNFEKETRKNSGQGKANPLYQPMTNVDNPMNDFTKN